MSPIVGDSYNHLVGGAVDVRLRWAPEMSRDIGGNADSMEFEGREYPVAFFGEGTTEDWDLLFLVRTDVDGDVWGDLMNLHVGSGRGQVLLWTDTFGNSFNCRIRGKPRQEYVVNGSDQNLYKIRLQLERVE